MKDLNLLRLINTTAATSLLLSLSACGKKDDEQTEVEKTSEAICEFYKDCAADEFADEFGSLSECEDYYAENFEYYAEEYGQECVDSNLALVDCVLESNACETVEVAESCLDEAEDFLELCGIEYDY